MKAETSFIEIYCSVPVCYKFVQECLVKEPAFQKCNFSASFPPVFVDLPSGFPFPSTETGISKNYCATKSGLPEVELRFCPLLIFFKY
jgi:hypothetical protein